MAKNKEPRPKIGAGSLSAFFRQGLRELRSVIFPEATAGQPAELGMWGTQTPGEIAQARRKDTLDPQEERPARTTLADHVRDAEARVERGRDRAAPTPPLEPD